MKPLALLEAPKGRQQTHPIRSAAAPSGLEDFVVRSFLGLTPQALCCRPFGAETGTCEPPGSDTMGEPETLSTMSDFVHLHLHSQFSLLDGANRLDDVIKAAGEAGMPAVALTDHGNMFGAIEVYNKARAAGIKPIVGMEAYVAQGSRLDRTPGKGSSNHLVLLAKNEAGYRNLIKLTSSAFLEGFYYKPRIDKELLRQ